MDASKLFNCCTGFAEPDWSQFDGLEINGCKSVLCEDGEQTEVNGGYNRHEAEFFTVYGHLQEGGSEDITDSTTFEEALAVANILAELSSLQFTIYC